MLNETQLQRIALMASALRPDWPARSVLTVITPLASRAFRDLAVAVAYVAADSESRTPARVLEPGPWWMAGPEASNTQTPPGPRDARCPTHPHEYANHCRSCIADSKVPVSYLPDQKGSYEQVTEALRAARTKEETP